MYIYIYIYRIWKPDILMYNSAYQEFDSSYEVNIVVTHNGECRFSPPAIFRTTCEVRFGSFYVSNSQNF